ncbi:unnamed protein product [Allacma fusca]|uniref:Sulfate transporter n=1 Tax=Allacma fusca TaxID=39272 RepID=A0A8J2JSC1_9HEXA|nr:unnamed protein product [Allacma fusca]
MGKLVREKNRRFSNQLFSQENMERVLKKRLPILSWLPSYNKGTCLADAIAGITVGLTVVPQSMAYAAIVGLSPEYGLYASYLGCFVYVILGSCRQVTIGPTAIMGLLTFEACGSGFPECAVLCGFYSGIFELVVACLQLGWVVSLISEPVTIGFTNAAAVTIILSQVKSFLGLSGDKASGFLGYSKSLYDNISSFTIADTAMGILSFAVLLLLKSLPDLKSHSRKYSRAVNGCTWLVSLARNIIVVVSTSLIAFAWYDPPFQVTGEVQGGFPPIGLPHFSLPVRNNITTGNSTKAGDLEIKMGFSETFSFIGNGPIIIALISILQNVAISKSFGHGQAIDATQEMLALGVSNTLGGFFSAIPISGSFSRSAVNDASGVKTPGGGFYTGALVLLSLAFLTPSFYYIPKASLAAVIICAVMFMIEYKSLISMWQISRMDFMASIMTFCCCLLLGMEYGILIGVAISLSAVIIKSLRPHLKYELKQEIKADIQYLYIEPSIGGHFPSVEYIRSSINDLVLQYTCVNYIVIDFHLWTSWDYTSAGAFVALKEGLKKMDNFVIFTKCSPGWIQALKSAGLKDTEYVLDSGLEEGLSNLINNARALADLNRTVIDEESSS